jgi:hypothetical protein
MSGQSRDQGRGDKSRDEGEAPAFVSGRWIEHASGDAADARDTAEQEHQQNGGKAD